MHLHHHINLVADRFADALKWLQCCAHLFRGDELSLILNSRWVEWPDLHCRDALFQQVLGERAGIGHKGIKIFVAT